MTLEPNTTISHYKILSPIGKGGMGEVYLAQDTELDRKAAIKLLSEEFGKDEDRVSRFIQEARAASALNHPNILTVYEIGIWNEARFIATEYIDGETLRDLLEKKESISLNRILKIGIQVAEAISAAHEAGIVHRDIKPENIMVRKDRYVKVLDFGLAKLSSSGAAASGAIDSEGETRALVHTNPGAVMGTVNYMSPEQAQGKETDARTDLWSLGVALYEMLSGQIPFEGRTDNHTIVSILETEPAPLENVPDELQRIVRKTLSKEKDTRYQTARDLLIDLKNLRRDLDIQGELERSVVPNATHRSASVEERDSPAAGTISIGDKEALVLTEFTNLTGDPVFDGTLKMALAFTLEQSPFLKIFADREVRKTLQLMGDSPDETVTSEVAKEICQRRGLKAYIAGTISSLGALYVLTLEAINAQTGEAIGRQLEQAESKEDVLRALGKAASGLREQLGESLASIEKFDAPLELTSSCLEAIQVLTLGYSYYLKGKTLEAIPFYKQAIEIDPEFAFAYIELAVLHYNSEQPRKAAEYVRKGYELRDRVSGFERFRINLFYHGHVSGDQLRALDELEVHRESYPNDYRTSTFLSDRLLFTGQYEKALEAAQEAIDLYPKAQAGNSNYMQALIGMNRFEEAKEFYENVIAPNFTDLSWAHDFLYRIALKENDEAAMARFLELLEGESVQYIVFKLKAATSGFRGQIQESLEYSHLAIEQAIESGLLDIAAQYSAERVLTQIIWDTGLQRSVSDQRRKAELRKQIDRTLEISVNKLTTMRSALALSLIGERTEAESILENMSSEFPADTLINGLWLPTVRAVMNLRDSDPQAALENLEKARRYERVGEFYPQFLRGQAYSQIKEMDRAVGELDRILNSPGEALLSMLPPLARSERARWVEN